MNEDELKNLLQGLEDETPNPAKRSAAIHAAVRDFKAGEFKTGKFKADELNENKFQGNRESERPTVNEPIRSGRMSSGMNRWIYSGFASAAVLVVAVMLVPDMFNRTGFEGANSEPGESELREPELRTQEIARQESVAANRSLVEADRKMRAVADTARMEQLAAGSAKLSVNSMPSPSFLRSMPEVHKESRDQFAEFESNSVASTLEKPVSTFSIDVDTAAYSYVRRRLNQGTLPSMDSIRLEEMVNYFPYQYPKPSSSDAPFRPTISVFDSPWVEGNKLVHIGIKGYEVDDQEQRKSNIVFLLDVSGSMNQPDKLPLVKQSMELLLSKLQPEDTVSIVVYAGAAGAVLAPTPVREKRKILDALNNLQSGGSTAGAAGIELAYQLAEESYVEDGVNRIILATDGDFNVGQSDVEGLKALVEQKRQSNIYLSVLGFGEGNYNDAIAQTLAQNGNGIAAYIDTLSEAQKVLIQESQAQLFPIANDVKIQVEFNPETVSEYRLLGYETRALKQEDFNNDKVDAGEIGSGHTVTAIYEVTPRGVKGLLDESRYQTRDMAAVNSNELGFLKIRYKLPGESDSKLIAEPILKTISATSEDVRFSVAVAGFAQLLKNSEYRGSWTLEQALEMALNNRGDDVYGYRAEFTQLIRKAMLLMPKETQE